MTDTDEKVQLIVSELLAHGEFGTTNEANRRNCEEAARAVLVALDTGKVEGVADIDKLAAAFQDGFTNGNAEWSATPSYHQDMFRAGVRCLLSTLSAPVAGIGDHEFSSDYYRPSSCLCCVHPRNHPIHTKSSTQPKEPGHE